MQKVKTALAEIKLVGIKIRTNNKNELSENKGKIFPCVHKYFHDAIATKIPHRKNPGTTYCVYMDYESDYAGEYTYFIGEEVTSFVDLPDALEKCVIQPQTYIKFTTEPGAMPSVVKNAWQEIWQLSDIELGSKRRYHADFEIYDERANDPTHQNIVLDIYVGIMG